MGFPMTQVAQTVSAPSGLPTRWPAPRHILVAVDYSEPAHWAVKIAELISTAFRADLRLVHVLDLETQAGERGELIREGEQLVADYPALPPKGARLDRVFRMGRPADEIVAAAKDWSADLIVLGTHGRKGLERLVLGSTAISVLRRAHCPVMCVGNQPSESMQISRILVAIDDSDQAARAADAASKFARALGAEVALAHVAPFALPVEPGYGMVVDHADEALRVAGEEFLARFYWPQDEPQPERLVRQGPIAQEILAVSREWKADLIVLGTHARHGLSRLLLGSTAESVLRRAACSVLCVSHLPQTASHCDLR